MSIQLLQTMCSKFRRREGTSARQTWKQVLVMSVLVPAAAMGQVIELVTAEEAKAAAQHQSEWVPKAISPPDAPQIELLQPSLQGVVKVPTPIMVRFKATSPAVIKPESFKALYGFMRLDITKKLLGAAKITEQGIEVAAAQLPSGRHQSCCPSKTPPVVKGNGRSRFKWIERSRALKRCAFVREN